MIAARSSNDIACHGRGRRRRGLDGRLGVLGRGVLERAQHVLVVVRLDDLDLGAAAVAPAAVDVGPQGVLLALEPGQLHLERGPLGAARGVGEVRLVDRSRRGSDRVHGADPSDPRAGPGSPGWRTTRGRRRGRRRRRCRRARTPRAARGTDAAAVGHLGDQHDPASGTVEERGRRVRGGHQRGVLRLLRLVLGGDRVGVDGHRRPSAWNRASRSQRGGQVDAHAHGACSPLRRPRGRPLAGPAGGLGELVERLERCTGRGCRRPARRPGRR